VQSSVEIAYVLRLATQPVLSHDRRPQVKVLTMLVPTTIYAQFEQIDSVQDYLPNERCLRFVGVDEVSFLERQFNSEKGCRTFLLDISWDYFVKVPFEETGNFTRQGSWPQEPDLRFDDWPNDLWVKISLTPIGSAGESAAYVYELFGEADPMYTHVQSMTILPGPAVAPTRLSTQFQSVPAKQSFQLSAYHVGQGMCALLKSHTHGFLFDVGAGTPVTRSVYRLGHHANGNLFLNELRLATTGLQLQAIISHPDSDHWKLLEWDPRLLASVKDIFVPTNTPALALKSIHVINKVHALDDAVVDDAGGMTLFKVHRSQPASPDRNGECLVVETQCIGMCLLPGDYVYRRWSADKNHKIASLSNRACDAVMVPHHGDGASAMVSILPVALQHSPAFFSAGTHAGYGHPTPASLSAHIQKGFRIIDHHMCPDIIECKLRP
jgi:beta-lactamase superfamily II metal-dependent hydrolase